MSGHSKWAKIKRQKGANDAKRGALFTKFAKLITIAAAEGGGDADMNFTLRLAVEKAREANMPQVNIERAIKKGTGELNDGARIEKVIYEGSLSKGAAFIVSCNTDNKNRTVADLRRIFENHGGSLGTSGSVMWQFDEVGYIELEPKKLIKSQVFGKPDTYEEIKDIDNLELELLEQAGINDIQTVDGQLVITTEKAMFTNVLKKIQELTLKVINSEIRFVPKEYLNLDEASSEKALTLMSDLDDHDDVENVFTNVNLD
jgi:YebC/PmpR family DNA-binding regulatory protein